MVDPMELEIGKPRERSQLPAGHGATRVDAATPDSPSLLEERIAHRWVGESTFTAYTGAYEEIGN